jgi:isopentenyl-diphosphate delta-isomerase
MIEEVVLVNEDDIELGTMEKLEAHEKGALHRAFSVILVNSKGELLLQKRAAKKYHSASLWTNACCSHPRPGESVETAAERRLKEELGIYAKPKLAYSFVYKVALENNLIEHELDHVLIGKFDGEPIINPDEIEYWKHSSLADLHHDILNHPSHYTYWFKLILNHPELRSALLQFKLEKFKG